MANFITSAGAWEQFWMEFRPNGMFALKTLNKGTYVSVQMGEWRERVAANPQDKFVLTMGNRIMVMRRKDHGY